MFSAGPGVCPPGPPGPGVCSPGPPGLGVCSPGPSGLGVCSPGLSGLGEPVGEPGFVVLSSSVSDEFEEMGF